MIMEDEGRIYHHSQHHQQVYSPYDSTFSTLNGWAGDLSTTDAAKDVNSLRSSGDFISAFATIDAAAAYEWPSYAELESQSLQQYSTGIGAFSLDGSVGVV